MFWRSGRSRVSSLTFSALQTTAGRLILRPVYEQPIIVDEVGQSAGPDGGIAAIVHHLRHSAEENHLLLVHVKLAVLRGSVVGRGFGVLHDVDVAIGERL